MDVSANGTVRVQSRLSGNPEIAATLTGVDNVQGIFLHKIVNRSRFNASKTLEFVPLDGVFDVEESVTGLVRTEGPVITLNGAWAQNIDEKECYIDFMGDKAGIRLQYGGKFTLYTAEYGALVNYTPDFEMTDMFANEINAFVDYVQHGTPMPSKVETVAVTAQLMQALYDSAAAHREVVL